MSLLPGLVLGRQKGRYSKDVEAILREGEALVL